jgi:hypothetical protein
MGGVDPLAGEIAKRAKIVGSRKPPRFESARLARRCCATLRRFAADNPAHRRIVTKALGVVDIFISGEAAEYRLAQHADQRMTAVLANAGLDAVASAARICTENNAQGLGFRDRRDT